MSEKTVLEWNRSDNRNTSYTKNTVLFFVKGSYNRIGLIMGGLIMEA